ncbi:MAG: hypothetical protein KAY50_00790 [Chitinophagaceae bacterium]|nr:hypothetical protein [Chitinophagaceae bacterium]
MDDTITVKELIRQLQKFDENKEVYISMVGLNASESWDAKLPFGDITVDDHAGHVRINFSHYM